MAVVVLLMTIVVSSRQQGVPLSAKFILNFPEKPAWSKCEVNMDGWSYRTRWYIFTRDYDVNLVNNLKCDASSTLPSKISYGEAEIGSIKISSIEFYSKSCDREFRSRMSSVVSAARIMDPEYRTLKLLNETAFQGMRCDDAARAVFQDLRCSCAYLP